MVTDVSEFTRVGDVPCECCVGGVVIWIIRCEENGAALDSKLCRVKVIFPLGLEVYIRYDVFR